MVSASSGGQAVAAAGQVAAACRAAALLIAAGLGEHRPAAAAASVPPAGGAAAEAAGTSPVRDAGNAALPPATLGTGAGRPGDPPAVTARVAGGTPTEGLGVAAVTVGLVLLVLTALTVHGLAGDRADSHRWRSSVLATARTARQDLRMRGEAVPVVVLIVVSIALWSAIVMWIVTR